MASFIALLQDNVLNRRSCAGRRELGIEMVTRTVTSSSSSPIRYWQHAAARRQAAV
jgi:hypothetical protein